MYEHRGVFRIQMCDSSPQGGRDWLNSQYLVLTPAALAEVFTAAMAFIHFEHSHDQEPPEGGAIHDQQLERYATLKQHVRLRTGAPVCLGSGRADAAHKLHALMHSLRLTCSSWQQVASVTNSIGVWVTDFGVEAVLSRVPQFSVVEVFPWIANEADHNSAVQIEAADEDAFRQCVDFRATTTGYDVDMSASMQVLGLLHVLRNATNDLHKAMSGWSQYVRHLTSISRLLTKQHMRQRFLSSCCSEYPWRLQHHLVEQFQTPVHLARWGTVAAATVALEDPLAHMLRQCWSKAKFGFRSPANADIEVEHVEEEEAAEHEKINEAICSRQFWGYRAMFSELASCISALMEWVESCPCHYSKDHDVGGSGSKRRRRFQQQFGLAPSSCVFRTRRAPEVAAGDFDSMFKVLFDTSAAELMARCEASLTPDELQVILGDWESGRQALALTFTVKLAAWRRLPLCLAGAAHHDETLARSMMAKAVQLYRSGALGSEHIVSRAFLHPDSILWLEVMDQGLSEYGFEYGCLLPKAQFLSFDDRGFLSQNREVQVNLLGLAM